MPIKTALRKWLVLKLQRVIFRLSRPVVEQLGDLFDKAFRSAASEVRSGNYALSQALEAIHSKQAELSSRIESLESSSFKISKQLGRTRDELNVSRARDLGPLLRILTSIEGSLGEVHDLLGVSTLTPEMRELPRGSEGSHRPQRKHAIYFSGDFAQGEAGAAGFLWLLRRGLDVSLESADGRQMVWIERQRSSTPSPVGILSKDLISGARLPNDSYNRMMRGGTESIEVLSAADAIAVKATLEANGRRDVRLLIRHLASTFQPAGSGMMASDQENLASGSDFDLMKRALASADAWVFPDQNTVERMSRLLESAKEEAGAKPIFTHELPNHLTAGSDEFVRAYRASLEEILAVLQEPQTFQEAVEHGGMV